MRLHEGRLTTLTEDTIESLAVAPGRCWADVLQSEVAHVVANKDPNPKYVPDETRIVL